MNNITNRELNKEQRKQQIIDVAIRLFGQKGYHNTPISLIAKEAGISKGLMYNYFTNKEDLLYKAIHSAFILFEPSIKPMLKRDIANTDVEYFIRESIKVVKDKPDYWAVFFSVMIQPSLPKELIGKFLKEIEPLFVFIRRYMSNRGVENPDLEAVLFTTTLDGVCMNYVANRDNYPINEIQELIIEKYCR